MKRKASEVVAAQGLRGIPGFHPLCTCNKILPIMLGMFLPLALTAALLLPATAMAQTIFRCGNTYSQEACSGGKVVEDKTTIIHDHRSGSTIFLCKSRDDSLFWSSQQCAHHNAYLERKQSVPPALTWEQKVAQAEAQWRKAQRAAAPPTPSYSSRPVQQAASGKEAICDALDERVKELDRMGRAGSLYYDLDWVRSERKKARDEQYRLRCR